MVPSYLVRSFAIALLIGLARPDAAAQEPLARQAGTSSVSRQDSSRLLRSARSEQALFERIRRNHLPWAWDGGSGECDERIGRFCLTHGDGKDDWVPPPEPAPVTRARERLLQRLDETARVLPADGWVAGQRVRYLMEARRIGEAKAAATSCRAAEWWCTALLGFVHHYAGEPAAADSVFSAALSAMPLQTRREWTDLSHLLESRSYRAYRRMPQEERERFQERFWQLGDPFYMRPGNELRSEHLARNVWDLLQDRAKATENISWGDDLRQIVLRYGWPSGWERIHARPGSLSPPSLVSHYSNSDRNLLPPVELLLEDDLTRGIWDVESDRPRTGYGLPLTDSMARWLNPLDHQVAVFRRGDSAHVVASYELPADSLPAGARVDAALALSSGPVEIARVERFPAGGLRDVLALTTAPGPLLFSLEVLSEQGRRAARARFGLRVPPLAPDQVGVSDLLLLSTPDELPDSLPAAMSRVRGSTRVRPGERIGVYWEVYGLESERPQSVTMSLRLLDGKEGWLERLAERVGLLSAADPIRLSWQEQSMPALYLARSLAVQIPEVAPGRYSLELSVALPGREPVTVIRAVEVK